MLPEGGFIHVDLSGNPGYPDIVKDYEHGNIFLDLKQDSNALADECIDKLPTCICSFLEYLAWATDQVKLEPACSGTESS